MLPVRSSSVSLRFTPHPSPTDNKFKVLHGCSWRTWCSDKWSEWTADGTEVTASRFSLLSSRSAVTSLPSPPRRSACRSLTSLPLSLRVRPVGSLPSRCAASVTRGGMRPGEERERRVEKGRGEGGGFYYGSTHPTPLTHKIHNKIHHS